MQIVSANLGGYDTIKRAPTGAGITAFIHTDQPDVAQRMGWRPILRRNPEMSHRYLSKAPRCTPHLVGHVENDVLWIDGSMAWKGHNLASLITQVPVGGVGCFRHRFRNTIQQEAVESKHSKIYSEQPVHEQVAQYGSVDELYEIGILVWRGAQRIMGPRWAAEILAWTNQDQLSFPYAARVCGVKITSLSPGNAVDNPWFKCSDHLVRSH